MEVEGSWTEAFDGSDINEGSGGTSHFLSSSSLTLAPLLTDGSSIRRSNPILITSNRVKGSDSLSFSDPSIPNPFPELCSPSKSPVLIRSFHPTSSDQHVLKVFSEDNNSRSLWVSAGSTAREVCSLLVKTAHCSDVENWALLELHPSLGLERCLEDHEDVLKIQAAWSLKGDTRLVFCKNYAKYEFFRKPTLFFPQNMISDRGDVEKEMTSSQLIQSGGCPEIQGFLHVKEQSRKSWKKLYFFLRRSGLYCSTKGTSKEPRHLQYVAELEDLNVYTVVNGRKLYGAPTDFSFCIKPSRKPVRAQDLKIFSAENEQTRTCWTSAFRLFKHGKQLQCNYQLSQLRHGNLEARNVSDIKSKSEASLVAMDFSGKAGGRVIQNPTEAQSVEREEGQAWRRREALRCSLPNLSSAARPASIHTTQPWFHGGVSRSDAQRLIEKQGLVDGMFLIRASQQHAQCFVLSLCYKLKTKHYLIIPCEDGGRKYFTMDDGDTLFIDLLQLVEFHQINKGILPVCLKHPCVCVAL
ncbi:growth factor receptor-bound protein 7 isoform X1 [Synchiropus splendidus]|uniref:growth factor receptor-bound protein 7 isoform X1 n=1 Tax=Synchiropus splendidus TaxID=270530 RepID=UPI00237E95FB|nr:growth factor receptor-bound protein 7 isoform X1 [Synchiropus splendidus]